MLRFLCTINLDDEKANYTIGQMLSHLQLSIDRTEFDKVEKLLKRREEKLKEEAEKEMKAEVEKVKSAVEMREDEISRKFLAEMDQMRKDLKDVEAKYDELVKWKVTLEASFEEVEKEKIDLVEEVRMLREMNEELKKREADGKVRLSELEKSKWKQVIVEESFEKLEKDKLRLGHELELKVEVEEGLRVRAEEDLEALEKSFNMLMNGGTGRVVPTIGLMEVAGCSRQSYFGTANDNVVDLTDEADGVLPWNIQTGNPMEGSETYVILASSLSPVL
ncbi:hypothetical protein QQ045_016517 [Rhodiola kirilowii]